MRKFELQLQLASLEWQVPSTNPTALDSSAKSLGDLKAPKRTLFPEPCPHIFAPGEPKLFTDLSLAEFCAGYAVIIQNCKIPSQKEQLLQHFQDLMTLASSYKWSAVRSFHSKVLRSIELGLTITSNDQTITSNSLSSSQLPSLTTQILSHPEPTESPRRSPPIPRHQICDDWSWYADCSNTDCPKQHVCIVCKRPDHRAPNCPKRKFNVPPCPQDPPSQV